MATEEKIKFRSKILKVTKELTTSDVEEIKYLLKDEIGQGVLENIKTSLDLLNALETLGWISMSSMDTLCELLRGIKRDDIANILTGEEAGRNVAVSIKSYLAPNTIRADEPINRKILDYVANQIATDWKRLARILVLTEAKIDQIDEDNRKSYEKGMQCLTTWIQVAGQNESWNSLKGALAEVPRHDIIRLVEKNFTHEKSDDAKTPPNGPPNDGNPRLLIQETSVSDKMYHTTLPGKFQSMRLDAQGDIIQSDEQHSIKGCHPSVDHSDSEVELVSSNSFDHPSPYRSDSEFEVVSSYPHDHHPSLYQPDSEIQIVSSNSYDHPSIYRSDSEVEVVSLNTYNHRPDYQKVQMNNH